MPRAGTPPGSRNWCFTINNYMDTHIAALDTIGTSDACKYLVYGKETGESGTPHLQGFVCFKSIKSFNATRDLMPQCHLEKTKGTPDQAADYCKKGTQPHAEWTEHGRDGPTWGVDADFTEHGTAPVSNKKKGENEKKRYERAWQLAKQGKLEEIDADIRMRLYGTIKKIRADYQPVIASLDTLDFWWYTGPSGCGKSRKARTENPDAYIKNRNKWWDGYVDQDCVIIDEWAPEMDKYLTQHLKTWCDHHSFSAETKGGTTCIRPKRLIVTSNYSIEECFSNVVDQLAIARRFNVVTWNSDGLIE